MTNMVFDFSDYEPIDLAPPEKKPPTPIKKPSASFDFSEYEQPIEEPKKQYGKRFVDQYKPREISREELAKLPFAERKQYAEDLNTYRDFLASANYVSGMTLGGSEKIPGAEIDDDERSLAIETLGMTAPFTGAAKLISLPLNYTGKLMKVGKLGEAALRVATSAGAGGSVSVVKQGIKGEGIDPYQVALESAFAGGLHTLIEGIPSLYRYFKTLSPTQQRTVALTGKMPDKLTPDQYKLYEQEFLPEIQSAAKAESEAALARATETANAEYAQEIQNVKARHENEMLEYMSKENKSEIDFANAKRDYENQLKQLAAEHELKIRDIEKQNQIAQQEFESQQAEYDKMKRRESVVKGAMETPEGESPSLQGRVSDLGEDINLRPPESPAPPQSTNTKVGNVISENTLESTGPNGRGNTTTAGKQLIDAVRANDAFDRYVVNEAYAISDDMNSQIETLHEGLVKTLTDQATKIKSIPDPSGPEKQLLNSIEKTLNILRTVDENGNITGFLPVKSTVLSDQAKSLRYAMDFSFEHGNTRGIYSPTVGALEDAVEFAASSSGMPEAAEANRSARRLYKNWVQDYDNSYIRPYREKSNFDYSKTFKSVLDTDNFNVVNNILKRSNASQQIGEVARRELVTKHLKPYIDNPRNVNASEFNKALRELGPVITPEEEYLIRQQIADARRTPVITGKKLEVTPPKPIKDLEHPETQDIPLFKGEKKVVEPIKKVDIPHRKVKVTDEMKMLAKLKGITTEEAIKLTNTPTGLKQVKELLSKTPSQRKVFENIGKDKIRQLYHEGNVEKTGSKFYEIFNKNENYAILETLLGEEEAAEVLLAAKQIDKSQLRLDALKSYVKKMTTLKALMTFGIL